MKNTLYRIGLDIGVASVGWAVVGLNGTGEPVGLHRLGVRIFDKAEQPKTGESLAAPRRMARGMRRRLRRKALRRADEIQQELGLGTDEHYLGIKFCCGCWLEGGEKFGNVLTDLADFVQQKRVHIVHFRNVSSPLPYFEETLLEDGYMDMYKIMDVLVKNGYDGTIYVDHVLRYDEQTGGEKTSFAYATGYMKGLMAAAYHQQK